MFGVVTAEKPLTIMADQRLMIEGKKILLCSSVVEKEAEETYDMYTENSGGGTTYHSHRILGRKKVVLNNGLKKGEKVLVLRMQGGQSFLVLDRVVK